jgi:predicted Zn-dependent protease with MMP-like domain
VSERESRRGRIAAAAVLAVFGACAATPVAVALARSVGLGWPFGLAIVALLLAGPAYLAVSLVDRDARGLVRRGEARRRRLAEAEAALARAPLPFACSADEFAELVEAEVDALPSPFRDVLLETGTPVLTEDQLDGNPFVLGLFSRDPVAPARGVGGGRRVDVLTTITLYRLPVVRAAGRPEQLAVQVRETLLHEVGHLLGMSERDLDRYSIGNQPAPDAVVVRPRSGGLR